MHEAPPQSLIELVERLGLATGEQVRGVSRRVRRLGSEISSFESVWVDALAQSRIITPFQAMEINAGQGDGLRIGPYLLRRRLAPLGYAECYLARDVGSSKDVRLAIARRRAQTESEPAPNLPLPPGEGRGEGDLYGYSTAIPLTLTLSQRERGSTEGGFGAGSKLAGEFLAPIVAAGEDGERIWASCEAVEGKTAAEWIAHNGRMPPSLVLEIARHMAAGLVELEQNGTCHGDIGLTTLLLTADGRAVLAFPGFRALVRPREGYALAEGPPERFDYLAPERITAGLPPNLSSDLFACGLVWWHLATGRPPFPGGSGIAKVRAAALEAPGDVRRWAPEIPAELAAAIAECTERDPASRPGSASQLAAKLGAPTRAGRSELAQCVRRFAKPAIYEINGGRRGRAGTRLSLWIGGAVALVVVALLAVWALRESPADRIAKKIAANSGRAARSADSDSRSTADRSQGNHGIDNINVSPARAVEKAAPKNTRAVETAAPQTAENVLLLGGVTAAPSLALTANAIVRGDPQRRAVVSIPAEGFAVREPNVRFENIDFAWKESEGLPPAKSVMIDLHPRAMIRLSASSAEFRGCTFRAIAEFNPPAAIEWSHAEHRREDPSLLASGRVTLADCVFRGVSAGVVSRVPGAVALTATNVLYVGGGPLFRLPRCPKADEPVRITLAHSTIRAGGRLLECHYDRADETAGEINITAESSVFATGRGAAVLQFLGPIAPDHLFPHFRLGGQGSILSPDTRLAEWLTPNGVTNPLDEASLSVSGLTRGKIRFAGPIEQGVEANGVVGWEGPSVSPDPPGINPKTLAWPAP